MVYDDINVVTLSANENLWSTINESEHKTCVYHMHVNRKPPTKFNYKPQD